MRILAVIGALGIIVAIGALIFFFGGFFNVAEDKENTGVVNWTLEHVRVASVARRASDTPPFSLDDPATVQAGARSYAKIGCANCHGGPPNKDWAKFSEGLKPVPADLKVAAKCTDRPGSVLGHQARHQDDRHAEFWPRWRVRPGSLEDCGLHQEAAFDHGPGLRDLDGRSLSGASLRRAGSSLRAGATVPFQFASSSATSSSTHSGTISLAAHTGARQNNPRCQPPLG